MTSVCWSCRLQLLANRTSRRATAELSSQVSTLHQLRPLPARAHTTAPARSLHFSASQRLPRVRTTSGPLAKRSRDDSATEHGALAEDGVESIGENAGDDASLPRRHRRAHRSIARHHRDAGEYDTNLESNVRLVRQTFKDHLPAGLLDEHGMRVYERLYGSPVRLVPQHELDEEQEAEQGGTAKVMSETDAGDLEEITTVPEHGTARTRDQDLETVGSGTAVAVEDIEDQVLLEYSEALRQQALDEAKLTPEQRKLLNDGAIAEAFDARADEIVLEDEEAELEEDELRDEADEDDDPDLWPGDEHRVRTHPLTAAGRFCTSPTAVELPRSTFIEAITKEISPVTTRQMRQVAQHIFGGPGLPYSTATPRRSRTMTQKPIPMQASDKHMNDMESFVYTAAVMPGVYASVLGALTEMRKRLGTDWIRDLMAKDGGPSVLDAGAGGAGALAWRDLLKAEWEAMHEELAMDGTMQPLSSTPPAGRATVLTASSSLRNRMTGLLDNTTFIPRMPEAVKQDSQEQRKQYDLIIAPHTLWPLEKDYMRKLEVDKLWSLLNPIGGVLVLLEKGVPRGFEVIAGARAHLLKRHIADPTATATPDVSQDIYSKEEDDTPSTKEHGMIVAPCTNHGPCPMYKYAGVSQARKNWCYFSQRFVRPPYLQHILGAKQRNHDDVEFSYVIVQRGRDLRRGDAQEHQNVPEALGAVGALVQDSEATDRAFQGYEGPAETEPDTDTNSRDNDTLENVPPAPLSTPAEPSPSPAPHALALPRLILPPLKRKKHIILDVCTPSATLERWTVTKGFSAQAYRDARKSSWGDLWALGAKHRMVKRVDLGKQAKQMEEMERRRAQGKKAARDEPGMDVEMDRWRKKAVKHKRRKEGRKKIDLLEL